MTERLAELGHPNTKLCRRLTDDLGLLFAIQFQAKASRDEDLQEAVAILTIISTALTAGKWYYAGFNAKRDWDTCLDRKPEYLFWRDYDDNWRHVPNAAPLKYLVKVERGLPDELRDTPAHAHVLLAIGDIERRLDRTPSATKRFDAARTILEASGDPKGRLGTF